MRLREFMHSAITCNAGATLADAARMMEGANVGSLVVTAGQRILDAAAEIVHSGCRRLPVVDSAGNLQGIISLDDLAVLFAHQADTLAQAVAVVSTPTRPS